MQYSGNIGGPLSKKASFFFTEDIRDIHDLGIVNAQMVDPTTFAVTPFSAAVPNPQNAVQHRPAPGLCADEEQYADGTLSILPGQPGQ